MIFQIKSEIQDNAMMCDESFYEAPTEKLAMTQWFRDNIKEIFKEEFMGKIESKPFKLEIHQVKVKMAAKKVMERVKL